MEKYKKYLAGKGYKHNSIRDYVSKIRHFLKWCESNNVNPKTATLNQLYDYQGQCRINGDTPTTLKSRIRAVSFYYKVNKRKTNPALLVTSESRESTIPKNQLDSETLIHLYVSYIARTPIQKRNKIILGLYIFQAIRKEEILLLEIDDLNLNTIKISVSSTKRTNKRVLDLNNFQVQDLQNYIHELRPQLLIEFRKQTNKLFVSKGNANGFDSSMMSISKELKANNSYFKSFDQLRESRRTLWLKEHNVRQTQYLSGMKYPTSLDRYKRNDVDNLRSKLNIIHPLERIGI